MFLKKAIISLLSIILIILLGSFLQAKNEIERLSEEIVLTNNALEEAMMSSAGDLELTVSDTEVLYSGNEVPFYEEIKCWCMDDWDLEQLVRKVEIAEEMCSGQ